jgi:putative transposon-encoded protein
MTALSNRDATIIRNKMAAKVKNGEIEAKVTHLGNGAHVMLPKDWLGKKVRVSLIENQDKESVQKKNASS